MWGCFDLIGKYWFVVRSDTIIDVIWTFVFTKSDVFCNHTIWKHFLKHFRQTFTRFERKISFHIFQCSDDFRIHHTLIIIHKIIHRLTSWLYCIINCTLLFASLELRLFSVLVGSYLARAECASFLSYDPPKLFLPYLTKQICFLDGSKLYALKILNHRLLLTSPCTVLSSTILYW